MTVIDFELDIFYKLPDGYVWCDAGCSVIGEHDGHPCTHCGGKGFHRDPQTPGSSDGAPRRLAAAGPKRPGGTECLDSTTSVPLGSQKDGI